MNTRLNAHTLARREKALARQKKRDSFVSLAQTTIDQCIITPDEIQAKAIAEGRKKSRIAAVSCAFAATMQAVPALANGNNNNNQMFGTVKNTIDFMMNLLMGVGICFIAFGVISLAISFQSHDDSQKSKAIMAIVGGAIAVSVKFVIKAITNGMDGVNTFLPS